jgi:hypothetical protein
MVSSAVRRGAISAAADRHCPGIQKHPPQEATESSFDEFAKNLELPPRHQDAKFKALILLLFFLVPWCLGGYEFGFYEAIKL